MYIGGGGQVWIIAEGKFGKLVIVTWNVNNIWSHTWTLCYHAICIQNMCVQNVAIKDYLH